MEQKVGILKSEESGLVVKIAERRVNIEILEGNREESEKVVQKAKRRAELAKKQTQTYEQELEIIKPVMNSVERELKEFKGKVEELLPYPGTLERASSYRANKVKPLFIKMRNIIAALAAKLTETMQELKLVKKENRNLKEKNNLLFSGCDDLLKENTGLKNIATMFERVVRVLGEDKVFMAVRQDEERERLEAEQKKAEQIQQEKTAGGETVSAYRDGEDVTDERLALEEQTETAVSKFLNRERADLEFDMFCMLEQDGMTIEVMVDGVSYTFTCSMQGDIIGMERTDGNRFDLRGK